MNSSKISNAKLITRLFNYLKVQFFLIKYSSLAILSFLFMILLGSFSEPASENLIANSTSLVHDTIKSNQINGRLNASKFQEIIDNKLIWDFYIGQSLDDVNTILSRYIQSGKIVKENVSFERNPHYFYYSPTNRTNPLTQKPYRLKTDMRFIYDNNKKLSTICLVIFSPNEWVPNDLKEYHSIEDYNKKPHGLKELEDELLNSSKESSNLKWQKRIDGIKNISFIYTQMLFEDLKQTYITLYGDPVYISKDNYPTISNNYFKDVDLLWLKDGKYIKMEFPGIYQFAEKYYLLNSSSLAPGNYEILLCSVYISTINHMM